MEIAIIVGGILLLTPIVLALAITFLRTENQTTKIILGVILVIVCLGSSGAGFLVLIYFVPALIAANKNHGSWVAILALNCLAFTVVLWIVALVWSLSNPSQNIVIQNPSDSATEELLKLGELMEKGLITDEEFAKKKAALLNA